MQNKHGLGAIPSKIDIRDYKGIATTQLFPDVFELNTIRVKDQGQVSSCVAHALSSVIEFFNSTQNKDNTEMSVGYIYGNRENSKHKGQGMIVRDAIAAVCECGDVPKKLFPNNAEVPSVINEFSSKKKSLEDTAKKSRFTTYYRLNSENDIKASLMNNGPVVFSMKWYDDISVINGMINTKCENSNGNHCMVIYGWNLRGWKILNSWGTNWGNGGRAILPYNIPIDEAWGIIDTYTDVNINNLLIKKPFNSILGKTFAKFINKLINLFKHK